MAKVLFTWELGGGLGHVIPFIPFIQKILENNHNVYFALQNIVYGKLLHDALKHSKRFFVVQSPVLPCSGGRFVKATSYADLLLMNGYHSSENLQGATSSWQSLLDLIKPDVLICNYSPTALLAARQSDMQKCQIGTGFFSPPRTTPLPPIKFWDAADNEKLVKQETSLVDTINRALQSINDPSLENFSDLFKVHLDILTTYQELDHYPQRNDAEYVGILQHTAYGQRPNWPNTSGKRIFAYLKPLPVLPDILKALNSAYYSSIVYCAGISAKFKSNYTNIHFSREPVNLAEALQAAELTITNANHDTLAACLLNGKPGLQLPITMEQLVLAKRSEKTGATKTHIGRTDAASLRRLIDGMLDDERYTSEAQAFARKYNSISQDKKINDIVAKLDL